jgi:sucrose phosphorylase
VLDTHDGIGVIDVGPDRSAIENLGLLDAAAIDELVEGIHTASGGSSRLATGAAASNVDLYQVNCTFADACGDEAGHLLARAVQVFLPGVPQVYYVGLLGGRNDVDLLQRTGVGRDINRHRFTADEVSDALSSPFTRRLIALLRLRRSHPAFGGAWELLPSDGPSRLGVRWRAGDEVAELEVDVAARTLRLRLSEGGEVREVTDLLDLER